MSSTYDVIVLGVGGIGSAALAELARRGARAIGLDRFRPPHDRGSSHGRTRMIRQAYFEHPDYVPLVTRALAQWRELEKRSGRRLFFPTGLLQVGPEDGFVVGGVLASARKFQLPVEKLSAADAESRFSGFRVPQGMCALVEASAGYLRVEDCVAAHLEDALRAGAALETDVVVSSWRADAGGVRVETSRGAYAAARLIVAAGAWSGTLLSEIGVPLVVRRKPQYWFAADDPLYRADRGCPAFLFELPTGTFYGFPRLDDWGLKAARHSGGEAIADPSRLDRGVDAIDLDLVTAFLQSCLPGVSRSLVDHSACMYTMSPDEHFLLDRHPVYPAVCFAAGLSGHGFKFAPVLGEALADMALTGETRLPVAFLSLSRFLPG
jgi:monomeric sarcosine oxidase